MSSSITADVTATLGGLTEALELLEGTKKDFMRFGADLLRQETERAFSSAVDPTTGRAWPGRSGSQSWPMLSRTGALKSALGFGYGVTRKDKRQKLFGKIKTGRRGDGAMHLVVAGAAHFGRTKRRTDRGTKLRGQTPRTGITPARKFFGMGRSARRQLKAFAAKRLEKAFE